MGIQTKKHTGIKVIWAIGLCSYPNEVFLMVGLRQLHPVRYSTGNGKKS